MTLSIDDFISHRFRGFDTRENSLAGLRASLAFGVKYLEFDIRVAACGTPIVYHDEYAHDEQGKKRLIRNIKYNKFKQIGGDFKHFPTFEQLLKTIIGSGNKNAHFLVDIKDAGFEDAIYALIMLYRLQKRVTYVSWLPDVLYAMHELDKAAPLCLSHWCAKPDSHIRSKHIVYQAVNGEVARSQRKIIHGERSGWFIDGVVSGAMRDILVATKGSVCVPVNMVSRDLVGAYHKIGLSVSVFSYVDLAHAQSDKDAKNIDLFFVDDRSIFDML